MRAFLLAGAKARLYQARFQDVVASHEWLDDDIKAFLQSVSVLDEFVEVVVKSDIGGGFVFCQLF